MHNASSLNEHYLPIPQQATIVALNAGLFVSRGTGIHPDRIIDSYELILVRSGCLEINEEDRIFRVGSGQTLVLWPGRRHYGAKPYATDLSFYWVHFRMPDEINDASDFVPQLSNPERPEYIAEIFHRLMDDQETNSIKGNQAGLLVNLMLYEASRAGAHTKDVSADVLASKAEKYIIANLDKTLSSSIIADALQYSSGHLERMFVKARGITLTRFIHETRIKEARHLLRESHLNVDQISVACGFNDPGFFRRIFRRQVGMSPREFRSLHTRAHINMR